MNQKRENLTYLILFFTTFTLLVYLVVDAIYARPGEGITAEVGDIYLDDLSDSESARVAHNLFVDRDFLFPIITPKPTPTRKIVPTPTPTEIPYAKIWKLKGMLGDKIAQIVDETGKIQYLEVGDEHITGVMIIEINPKEGYVEVEFMNDGKGRRKKIYKDGAK